MVTTLIAGYAQPQPAAPAPSGNGAAAPAPAAAPEKVYNWTAVGIHTPGEAAHAFEQELMDKIEEASGGRIKIDLHPIGAIVPPFETFDAVRDYGLEVIQWTPEEIARGMEYSRSIWEDFARDDLSRRTLDSQMDYMRMIGLIE